MSCTQSSPVAMDTLVGHTMPSTPTGPTTLMQRSSPRNSPTKKERVHASPSKSPVLHWQFYDPSGQAIAPRPYTLPVVPGQTCNPSMSELMDTLMAAPAFPEEEKEEKTSQSTKSSQTMRDIEVNLRESNKAALVQLEQASHKNRVQARVKEPAHAERKESSEPVGMPSVVSPATETSTVPFLHEAKTKAAHTATVMTTTVRDIEAGLRKVFSDVRNYASVIHLPSRHYGAECGLVVEKLDMTYPDDHFHNTELQLVKSESEWSTFPANLSLEIRSIVWQQVLNPPKTTHVLSTKLPKRWSFNLDDCPVWTLMPCSKREVFLAEITSMHHVPIYADAVATRLRAVTDWDGKFSSNVHLQRKACAVIEESMQDEIQREVARMNKCYNSQCVWSESFNVKMASIKGWFAKLEHLLLQSAGSQYGSYEMQCILAAATNLLGPVVMAALCLNKAGPDPRVSGWSAKQNAYNAWMGAVSVLVVLRKSRPREEPIHNLASMFQWVIRRGPAIVA